MPADIGPFRLLEPVARGGMAEVWGGVHIASGVAVAVKVVTGELAKKAKYRAQFRNEVRAMARLSHPGIISVLDYGEVDARAEAEDSRLPAGSPYLVMEHAGAGSLFSRRTPFDWLQMRTILLELLDALAHAHARGVIHRDVKPGNVLFASNDDLRPGLKLTDFGIARTQDLPSVRNPDEDRSGTLHYMSPEQLLGLWRDQGPWTDLYAVGCLAWRLATSRPPFHGLGGEELVHAQLRQPPPRFRPAYPVPRGFLDWVLWLLQKEPGDRFRHAADAANALENIDPTIDEDDDSTGDFDDTDSTLAIRPWRPGPPKIPEGWEPKRRNAPPASLVGAGLGLFPLRVMPLVGRNAERQVLWDALRRVHKDGRVEVVVVHGPSGIGKSRLVDWFTTRANEVGAALVMKATADAAGARGAAIGRMVERHLRTENLNREDLGRRVAFRLGLAVDADRALGQSPSPAVFECEALVDVVTPDPNRTRNPELRTAVLRRLVARTCRERPVILWLEDASRDVDALAFALDLVEFRDVARMPALIVVTARDDIPDEWERTSDLRHRKEAVTSVRLGTLPPADHKALVAELLVLDAPLAAQIEERTAGHPGFAVQLVGELVERGALLGGPGGFRAPPGTRPSLPDDLHATWQARVDQVLVGLSSEAGALLERAAALGVEVSMAEWEEVIGLTALEPAGRLHDPNRLAMWRRVQSTVDQLVDRLSGQGLVDQTPTKGFAFTHRILRDSLERRARDHGRLAGHHRACADMLDRRRAAGEHGLDERLGRHRLMAGEPAAAVDPLLEGTRVLATQVGFRSALALLQLAEEAMHGASLPATDPRWGRTWNLRADMLFRAGDITNGLQWLKRTIDAANAQGWDDVYREALVLQVPAVLFTQGPDAAEVFARELVARATRADDEPARIAGLRSLSDVHAARRESEKAAELADEAVARARSHGDPTRLAACLRTVGLHAVKRKEFPRAREALVASVQICDRIGSRAGSGDAWLALGHAARLSGAFDEAWDNYNRAQDMLDAVGSGNVVVARFYLAMLRWARGEAGDAKAELEALLPWLALTGWRRLSFGAHGLLAVCAVDLDDKEGFDRHVEALLPVVQNKDLADEDLALPLERAGERWLRRGDRPRARRAWTLAMAIWSHLGDVRRAEIVRAKLP